MSIIKWRANTGYSTRDTPVQKVECEKESDSYVWIAGKKDAKMCQHHAYFDTPGEAVDYLTTLAQKEVDRYQSNLTHAINAKFALLEKLILIDLSTEI